MDFMGKDKNMLSYVCMSASVICVALAGLGFLWEDIWLASTQWMVTAAVFGLFGVYLKLNSQ